MGTVTPVLSPPPASKRTLSTEDEEVVRHATDLLDRYVIDATREAVATLELRVDSASYEVSALLARALLRLWVQVGGQDDTLLLRAEEMALRTLALDPSNNNPCVPNVTATRSSCSSISVLLIHPSSTRRTISKPCIRPRDL